MASVTIRQLATSMLVFFAAAALRAEQPAPFAYAMQMTPEDGPTDPAIEKRYTAKFTSCQKIAVTTQDSAACYDNEFTRQDAVLNRAWRTTIGRFSKNMRGPLLAAQRKWISDRDPFCKSIADGFKGGTIMPIIYSDCRVEQTIRRTMWLEKLR